MLQRCFNFRPRIPLTVSVCTSPRQHRLNPQFYGARAALMSSLQSSCEDADRRKWHWVLGPYSCGECCSEPWPLLMTVISSTTGQNCHETDMDFPWKYRKLMKCAWKFASWVFHGPYSSLASQTFHSDKGEEKSGNLPIPFWFVEFGIILRHVNGILCCHVQCPCTCRFW